MARAVWSGSISFGLVNVPVKAFTAVRDHTVHFHQLEKKTGARIRYQKVSDTSGKEVDADDIELGYELSKGRYVTLARDELDEMRPQSTRSVDVADFVSLDDIDPVFYENTYWLAPDGDAATKAYQLLLAAMEDRRQVGIGSVVMRNKQYLAAVRPLDGALAMSTMRFADEVLDRSDIDELPSRRSKPAAGELKLATQIIDALATDWDPGRYHDTFTDELHDLLDRKAKGDEVVEEAGHESAKVLDLMAALQASVDGAASRRAKVPSSKKASSKKAPSKASGRKSAGPTAASKRRSKAG